MGNRREIEVAGKNLLIYDHDIESLTAPDLVGSCLWDCALTLAYYLPIYARSHPLAGKIVLELGAGTGLPGIVAGTLGAALVTLTDRPALLPGLRRNVEANAGTLSADVQVLPLEWGNDDDLTRSDLGGRPFDLILMSDLLYDVSVMPDLCRTLKGLSDRKTEILLSYELRYGTTECFKLLKEAGFRWAKVAKEDLDPVWQSEDIGVFRICYL